MKLLTRSIYLLLFMGFSLFVNAGVEPTVSIKSQNGHSFSLHLKDMKSETFKIKLSDKDGFILLTEKVEDQNEYLKLINLKKLPTGSYNLRIENERKIILQKINVLKQRLTIDQDTKREIYKPSITSNSSHLNLNMVFFEDGFIRVMIKDEKSNVLYQEHINKKGSIHKQFKITALPAGNYVAVVKTKHYAYQYKFSVELDNKRNRKATGKQQKKRNKKGQGVTATKEYQLPADMEAIKSKIMWQHSQKN